MVAAAITADFVARDATQSAVAANVTRSTHSEGSSVDISSFPFLYNVAAHGRLDRIQVTDRGVPAGPFRIDRIHLDARQVRFDRHALLESHYVHIVSVGQATITVEAKLSDLESSIADRLGAQVTASSSDHVVISASGIPLVTLDLTRIPLVPVCPVTVSHTGDTYQFTCTVAPVPETVLAALSKATSAHKV